MFSVALAQSTVLMKKLLLSAFLVLGAVAAHAQPITITVLDMPVTNDTLRYSYVDPIADTIDLSVTGANTTWNFNDLVPVAQGLDVYKTALSVHPLYGSISPGAYGYKIADSLPGPATPVAITEIYNFFSKKNNPSRFVAEAFAAKVAGTPIPINYSDEDEWYLFPLDYNDYDSTTFRLSYSFMGLGSFSQEGTRKTTVDGWGTITTPYTTTPQNCLRVRSVIEEVDTIRFQGNTTPIERNTVEYKWLTNGEHYPLLWVTTTITAGQETVSAIRFRDNYRIALGITSPSPSVQELSAYPNPATHTTTLGIPADWKHYSVEVFDAAGKLITTTTNQPQLNTSAFSKGHYIIRVTSQGSVGYVRLVK